MKIKSQKRLWLIVGDGVCEIAARPVLQQGKIVYRSESGTTYRERYVRTWESLTQKQKAMAYESHCQRACISAEWAAAKDKTLKAKSREWIAAAERERDKAIEEIMRGDEVEPPREI